MSNGTSNVMQEEQLTATVISHPDLQHRTVEFASFLGKEVIIDPGKAKVLKLKNESKLHVRISLKENPRVISTIFANYLTPLCEKTKQFLSIGHRA